MWRLPLLFANYNFYAILVCIVFYCRLLRMFELLEVGITHRRAKLAVK